MGLISWIDNKTNKLGVWDIAFVKIGAMIFGLIVGAYIPSFVRQFLLVFIVLFVIFSIKPIYKFFK